ncbi:MAG: methylamine utilization protein MauE [Proteobacteria bacterium]|nr:methylamine utilization protein MauE [Pseudomonadota bacterium]
MSPATLDPALGWLLVSALGLLLAQAAAGKWRRHEEFAAVLANYRLFPAALVRPLAWLVPAIETVLAGGLLLPATRASAALVGAALMLAYAGAITVNLRRGRLDLDCGCAGPAERRPIAPWMLVRNALLAAAFGLLVLPWSARALTATDLLTVGGGLAVTAMLYLAVDRLFGEIAPRGAALRGAR